MARQGLLTTVIDAMARQGLACLNGIKLPWQQAGLPSRMAEEQYMVNERKTTTNLPHGSWKA